LLSFGISVIAFQAQFILVCLTPYPHAKFELGMEAQDPQCVKSFTKLKFESGKQGKIKRIIRNG
jgi:hypothetical protein